MDRKHETVIFNWEALLRCHFPLAVTCIISLVMAIAHKHAAILVFIIPCEFYTLVLALFMTRIQNFFSRRAELDFNDEGLNITEYHLKSGVLLNNYSINWADMNSYQYYDSGSGDAINLKLYFNNGKSKLLKFRGENISFDEALADENSLFRILQSFIKNYNDTSGGHMISFHKFFIIRGSGNILIWSWSIIGIALFIDNLLSNGKAPFVWLFAGPIFTLMFMALKRKYNGIYDRIVALG